MRPENLEKIISKTHKNKQKQTKTINLEKNFFEKIFLKKLRKKFF
jgi:hypothetical protein